MSMNHPGCSCCARVDTTDSEDLRAQLAEAQAQAAATWSALDCVRQEVDGLKYGENFDFPDYGRKALGADAGKALLARLEAAEAVCRWVEELNETVSLGPGYGLLMSWKKLAGRE